MRGCLIGAIGLKSLDTGWAIGGGTRILLFNNLGDAAWTLDLGLLNIHNVAGENPPGFTLNRRLERPLERRRTALGAEGGVDWAHAETLAFATILTQGTPIRLTGASRWTM